MTNIYQPCQVLSSGEISGWTQESHTSHARRLHVCTSNQATVPAPTVFNVQTWKMCRHTKRFSTPAGNPDFGMTRSTCRSKFAYAATSRNTCPGSRPLNSAVFCDLRLIIPHDLVQRSLEHLKCICIFTCLNTFFTFFLFHIFTFLQLFVFHFFKHFFICLHLLHVHNYLHVIQIFTCFTTFYNCSQL